MNIEWINDVIFMHDVGSKHGLIGNHMLAIVHWFMLILFVFWTGFLGVVLWKFRAKKNPKASYDGMTSHFPSHLEIGVVIVEVVLLMGFAFPLWARQADVASRPTGGDVVNIRAVGEQFRWNFHYAGPDKAMGITSYERISGDNPVGLVKEDPNAKDDFVSTRELIVPKDRPVIIQVTSKDVIHGLALVSMFVQQDAFPGMEIPLWFIPQKIGTWDIVCAQLCGASHAQMTATIEVKSQKDFDEWLAEQKPLLPQQ